MVDAVELIPDEELERLAIERGRSSIEARILQDLRKMRAKDRQTFAFRIGACWFTGPTPDRRTELWLLDLANEAGEEE